MKIASDYRPIVRTLRKAGHEIRHLRGGHLAVEPANGGEMVVFPSTPGRGRGLANFKADLRRRGLLP